MDNPTFVVALAVYLALPSLVVLWAAQLTVKVICSLTNGSCAQHADLPVEGHASKLPVSIEVPPGEVDLVQEWAAAVRKGHAGR